MKWPEGKDFAFTIVDDTDNSTVENIKPIYDFLHKEGLITTKTVWVYPPRDHFTGECLTDEKYLEFIKDIIDKGYEIALHNVGSGVFTRDEIIQGIEEFNKMLGFYPKMHINHSSNKDNIYWGSERYTIIKPLIKLIYGKKREYYGEDLSSSLFWGDICKEHIKYIRNYVFNGIDTLKYDPQMPYRVRRKEKFSNFWFSSSDGHTIEEFNDLIKKENIDYLEKSGGCCIVYTHFASEFVSNGKVNEEFKENIRYLSSKNGWFVPASTILDYLLEERKKQRKDEYISKMYLTKLDIKWLFERIIKKLKYGR